MAIPLEYDSCDVVDGGLAVVPTTKPSTGQAVINRTHAAKSKTGSEEVNEFIMLVGKNKVWRRKLYIMNKLKECLEFGLSSFASSESVVVL